MMTKSLQVTAASWALISVAHAAAAKDWQSNAKFQTLSRVSRSCARIGWYQGSGFMFISALLNYAWSRNPALLLDPVHKAIAGALVAVMWVSGWRYAKAGVTGNMVAVGAMGALQTYSVFVA